MIDKLAEFPPAFILFLVSLGSGFEYVFPPFPGDTVTVAATAVASHKGIAIWTIIVVATLGSVVGSTGAWLLGHWVVRSGRLARLKPEHRKAVDEILLRFERHGAAWLALNRFIPGLRAFCFVAAAMAGIPLRVATAWSALSGAAWSCLLVFLGFSLAANIDALNRAIRHVQFLTAALVVGAAFFLWQYWRTSKKPAPLE